ncbi:UBX domain protein [Rhizodiscina lignyota]|uniref:UBX domain protein n=1 Tax=Rhizodiscina lignyota TaxID=1504668 RepID=A0A9P4IFK4_9PEZI|nr:UBX domain protein [Rhizodiscina lignyota]
MASHVVIIDSSFRRATVKTTPGKHLNDILEEGCKKLGLRPEQYGLKYNKKALDLSLTYRLSSLPSGAQLELVQASRSPTVVNVALQLPASENNVRLTDKFPSTTSFWQILRRFESGAAGSTSGSARNLNFTQRGVPQTNGGQSGAGRLNYEMPVIQVMNRELSTFEDLQKCLAQVGLNSGSALLRINFKNSGSPLEDAMADISRYFQADESEQTSVNAGEAESSKQSEQDEAMDTSVPEVQDPVPAISASDTVETSAHDEPTTAPSSSTSPQASTASPTARPMTVFAAPVAPSPQDPRFAFNDSDFEPTLDHAKLHQARLNNESRNKRLPSDAELAAAEKARDEKLATVAQVQVRVRFPDQTSILAAFKPQEPASCLYDEIRQMLESEGEPFVLRYLGPNGLQTSLRDGKERLVPDLKLQGRVLMNFAWDDKASVAARQKPVLKSQYRQQAQQIKVEAPALAEDVKGKAPAIGNASEQQQKPKSGGGDVEAKLKKFLRFGKK